MFQNKEKMLKISGAKLSIFDFRDYALLTRAAMSGNVLLSDSTLVDIAEGNGEGFLLGTIPKDYLLDANVYDLSVVPGDKTSGTITDNSTKESMTVKKLGKVPKGYKKAVFRDPETNKVRLFISTKKVNAAAFRKVDEPSWVNYAVNRSISESHFSPDKYNKVAAVAEKKMKDNASRVTFKISDSARNKIVVLNHKKLGICAAIYFVDPVNDKRVLLSFGSEDTETPTTNVEEHYHFTTKNTAAIPGFVGNLTKHLLFAAGKIVKASGKELGKGDEKLALLYKAVHPLVKTLAKQAFFVGLAIEAIEAIDG